MVPKRKCESVTAAAAETLAFSVDGVEIGVARPEEFGGLLHGRADEQADPWAQGSRIAPFDKEVGLLLDFKTISLKIASRQSVYNSTSLRSSTSAWAWPWAASTHSRTAAGAATTKSHGKTLLPR